MSLQNCTRLEGGKQLRAGYSRKRPYFTIITAVYNGEKFIEQAIQSVISQSFDNFEFIIMDGGSSDGTIDIIKRYDDWIDLWISEPDVGIYDAWNKALVQAHGEWISFLGSDDAYYNNALKDYASFIDRHNGGQLDYVSSCVDLVDSEMNKIEKICEPWSWRKFRKRMKIAHVGSMHHNSLYERYGLYDSKYRITGDYEFLLRPGKELKAGFFYSVTAMMRTNGVSDDILATFKEAKLAKSTTGKRNIILCSIENIIDIGKVSIKRVLSQSRLTARKHL
jgi:glycosyltransferase involved in cell wall biosynthesis